jgi:hypothetical protein
MQQASVSGERAARKITIPRVLAAMTKTLISKVPREIPRSPSKNPARKRALDENSTTVAARANRTASLCRTQLSITGQVAWTA